MSPIHFYSVKDVYGEFSNFAPFPIELGGLTWPTSEHYFQAQKFTDEAYREEIRNVASPMAAAKKGRSRKYPLRGDWEAIKEDVMRRALAAKFEQHADLRRLLLETGDAELVEHTANDAYWGDGGDGSGRNRLGVLLVELRERLRREDAAVTS